MKSKDMTHSRLREAAHRNREAHRSLLVVIARALAAFRDGGEARRAKPMSMTPAPNERDASRL